MTVTADLDLDTTHLPRGAERGDAVECYACGYTGLVESRAETCPACRHEGGLAWQTPENPEASQDVLRPEGGSA